MAVAEVEPEEAGAAARHPPWRVGRPALASALPTRAASRTAVVTASRRAAAILESTSQKVSTADNRAYAVGGPTPRRALATLVSTSSGVILAAMSRECCPEPS